ncbi:hypothetical protein [Mycobacterium asiaticum]|uniref:hypothetical protein n=1 Tax=Mycobacterium asiaticum TaxID=1790 RepID=UPI000A79F7F9|nr:hypothetical protein [Mycobacterium asiaticum]
MSLHSHEVTRAVPDQTAQPSDTHDHGRGRRAVVNWVLALLTIPAAVIIAIFAVGAAMSFAACSGAQCPELGPSGLVYGVLLYGAPVIAGLTIIASFFTAFRRRGFIVPLIGLALLLADFAAVAILF